MKLLPASKPTPPPFAIEFTYEEALILRALLGGIEVPQAMKAVNSACYLNPENKAILRSGDRNLLIDKFVNLTANYCDLWKMNYSPSAEEFD